MTDAVTHVIKGWRNRIFIIADAACVGCSERLGGSHGIVGAAAGSVRIATSASLARREGRWAPGHTWTYHDRPDSSLAGRNCGPDRGLGCSRRRRGAGSRAQSLTERRPLPHGSISRADAVGSTFRFERLSAPAV